MGIQTPRTKRDPIMRLSRALKGRHKSPHKVIALMKQETYRKAYRDIRGYDYVPGSEGRS